MTAQPHMAAAEAGVALDVGRIRKDFPILSRTVHGKPLVYLDNAATTQKPDSVIKAIESYYRTLNANIHRGVHYLSEAATESYEQVRESVKGFVNASSAREIVFVRGTTEAVNLVAGSFGQANVGQGDEILISGLEHHSNIVPWQILCGRTGAILKVVPITDSGEIRLDEFGKLLNKRTKLVAIAHVSNSLGTVVPVKAAIAMAHERRIPVFVDGAQAVPHLKVDVRDIDADFYAFSGHKMYGPTGIGVLYGKMDLLDSMPPYQGGGDMIKSVSFEKTVYNDIPYKFEAGTPNIAGVLGLGAAIDFLGGFDMKAVGMHEETLLQYATERLSEIEGLRLIGTAGEKAGVVSFVLGDVHPHDIGTILDREGIAVRTGHHCAQPVMTRFGVPATVRASFALYNTREEIDLLVGGLTKAKEVFG
jgi:cysteine desulfurase/selenocysteine lyase